MHIDAELPCIITATNCYELEEFEDRVGIFIKGFKVVELGCEAGDYIGLAYVGKKPSADIIETLLDQDGIFLGEDEDDDN